MIRFFLAPLLLALCAAVPAAAQPSRLIEGADPAIWQGEAMAGELVHRESGMRLPEAFGNFRRTRVGALSATDVFANYGYRRDNGRETVVTVYLFRPGELPEHRLAVAAAAIGVRSPGAFLWSDGPFLIGSTPEIRAYKATFKTGIGPNTIMDYLYFAPLGRWTVKVRATLDSTTDIENEREIDALVRALPWSRILTAAGECTGWACRLDTAFPFNNHIFEGMPELLDRSIGDGAAVYQARGHRLVQLSGAGSALAGAFGATYGGVSVREPLYAVQAGEGRRRRTVRFFSGLPTAAQFERTVELLRRHPEPGAIVSPVEAAYHLELIE